MFPTRLLAILTLPLFPVPPVFPLPQVFPDSALLASYRWRNIGPDRGGRSIAVSGVKGRPQEAYFGATGGGRPPTGATPGRR
jgi:hypothetical protein